MTTPINPMTAALAPTAPTSPTTPNATQRDLHKVATEFEAMLLRQLLGAAKVGGSGSYADMAVESLSDGLSRSGGIGLARELEAALATQMRMHEGALSHSSEGQSGRSSSGALNTPPRR
jgi:Rod binding domain-containing protein